MINTAETRKPAAPPRRRLEAREREQQIVDGATDFFARRGLDAQMRELAAELDRRPVPGDAPLGSAADSVARFGGEEFVILLPNTTVNDAASLADRLRRVIGDASFLLNGQTVTMTMSVGVAAVSPGNAPLDCALRRADAAMYAAKMAGGARHCFYAPEMDADAQRSFDTLADLVGQHLDGRFLDRLMNVADAKLDGVEVFVQALGDGRVRVFGWPAVVLPVGALAVVVWPVLTALRELSTMSSLSTVGYLAGAVFDAASNEAAQLLLFPFRALLSPLFATGLGAFLAALPIDPEAAVERGDWQAVCAELATLIGADALAPRIGAHWRVGPGSTATFPA